MRFAGPFLACLVLLVAACAIGRPIPTATTYNIEPPPARADPPAPGAPTREERLQVERVRVAAPYDRTSLIYRLSAVRYVSDPYHAFLADPGPMLANRIAEWLDAAGLFKAVAGPGAASPAPLALEATVTELYGDFQEDAEPAAVMSVQFVLIDRAHARAKVLYERAIGRRIPLASTSPEALVRGYGSALAEILAQLAADLPTTPTH